MQKSCVQLLKETYSSECTSDCNGKWLECGLDLLQSNDTHYQVSATRYFKVLILVAENIEMCSYMLRQTREKHLFYRISVQFSKPSPIQNLHQFAWMGVEDAEVVLLNYFH
jgi:hypothetical protein